MDKCIIDTVISKLMNYAIRRLTLMHPIQIHCWYIQFVMRHTSDKFRNLSSWWLNLKIKVSGVRSWKCVRLVTVFCYQLIANTCNKTAIPPWHDPLTFNIYNILGYTVLNMHIMIYFCEARMVNNSYGQIQWMPSRPDLTMLHYGWCLFQMCTTNFTKCYIVFNSLYTSNSPKTMKLHMDQDSHEMGWTTIKPLI